MKKGDKRDIDMSAAKEDDVCNHVKVVVRVRPESQKERDGNFSKVVRVLDQHVLVFDPKEDEVSFFQRKKPAYRDINKRKNKDLKFMFDAVFAESSSQLEVFENTTKSVIDGFLNGYNCTGNFAFCCFPSRGLLQNFYHSGCCRALKAEM